MKEKLQMGAYAAINQCLRVQPQDKVVIVTDQETIDIGNAIKSEAAKVTNKVLYLKIEDFTQRPATELPQELVSKIREFKPTVSIYAAQGKPGELPVFRSPLIEVFTKEFTCRHAHMIGITRHLMEEGMNADYELIYKVTHRVLDIVEKATKIEVTDTYGTNIIYELDPQNIKWVPDDGLITKENWSNLPSGEVFTAIKNCNGTFAGWVLGDYLSEKYGELEEPLKVYVENSFITKVTGPKDVVKDFEEYINQYDNGKRAAELGIGTLVSLKKFVGNLLQDEKFPGVHMAFGHGYPEKTGADWDCPSHIDIIAKNTTIKVTSPNEEQTIMTNGKFNKIILN